MLIPTQHLQAPRALSIGVQFAYAPRKIQVVADSRSPPKGFSMMFRPPSGRPMSPRISMTGRRPPKQDRIGDGGLPGGAQRLCHLLTFGRVAPTGLEYLTSPERAGGVAPVACSASFASKSLETLRCPNRRMQGRRSRSLPKVCRSRATGLGQAADTRRQVLLGPEDHRSQEIKRVPSIYSPHVPD